MDITIFLFGFLFGFAMQYAHLNRFNTISGMATLEDFTMAKTMGFAIGLGAILIAILVGLGLAEYHIKPIVPVANILGGLIFGLGMAILGYCPGTLPISLGQGALDALIGIVGGLLGGLCYTLLYEHIAPLRGESLGSISVYSLTGQKPFLFYLLTLIFGGGLMYVAFLLHKKGGGKNYRWLITGISFAIINSIMILPGVFDRTIGASTVYPYAADLIFAQTDGPYFEKITPSGSFQIIFLAGAFLAGLLPALFRRDFRLKMVHERWEKYKGDSVPRRIIWAFVGGFLLIFGARYAGGCASGHILSGVMQMGVGSLLFSIFTFASFFAAGKFFYKSGRA